MKTICRKLHFSSKGFERVLRLGIFRAHFSPICGVTSHLGTFPNDQTISGIPPGGKLYRDFPQETNHIGTFPNDVGFIYSFYFNEWLNHHNEFDMKFHINLSVDVK